MNNTIKCHTCNIIKPILDFPHSINTGKPRKHCKICVNKKARERGKKKDGLISKIYHAQQSNSKKRGHIPPAFTKKELENWMMNQPIFHKLYDQWALSGYKKKLVPSVDRIDEAIGYMFGNIQIMTFENNAKKYRKVILFEKTNGSKAVVMTDQHGLFIAEFISISLASRCTKLGMTAISDCCNNKRKSLVNGFMFKFK